MRQSVERPHYAGSPGGRAFLDTRAVQLGRWEAETPAEVLTEAEQMPRRARYLVPMGLPRRDEVLAVCVVAVVLAHVLFAQLTILLAAAFYLITRATTQTARTSSRRGSPMGTR